MKKTILFAVAVATAVAAFYFMKRKTVLAMQEKKEPGKRSHHRTEVFAKAKI